MNVKLHFCFKDSHQTAHQLYDESAQLHNQEKYRI